MADALAQVLAGELSVESITDRDDRRAVAAAYREHVIAADATRRLEALPDTLAMVGILDGIDDVDLMVAAAGATWEAEYERQFEDDGTPAPAPPLAAIVDGYLLVLGMEQAALESAVAAVRRR